MPPFSDTLFLNRITAWTSPGEMFTSLVYWRNVLVADIFLEMQRLNVRCSCGYNSSWYSFMRLVFRSSCKVMGQIYRGADKSLVPPGRKQATVTEDFDVHISYL
jgi:hypothetical protein